MQDVRWKQRFSNFLRAFKSLDQAVKLSETRSLTELEQQGLIQSFEFTHELAWKVLKDFLQDKGISGLIGSKDATRTAFQNELIENGDDWMKMIESRNLTSHTYNEAIAKDVVEDILKRYHPQFRAMAQTFSELSNQPESEA